MAAVRKPSPPAPGAASPVPVLDDRHLSDLFDISPIGVAITDADSRILRVNRAFASMLGYEPEELVGRSGLDLVLREDLQDVRSRADRVRSRQSEGYRMRRRYRTKSGGTVWVDLRTSAYRDPDGRFLYGLGIVENLTDRLAAEVELEKGHAQIRRQKVALERKNAALKELLDQVSQGRNRLEERLSANLQLVVKPLLDQARAVACAADRAWLDLLESSLEGVLKEYGVRFREAAAVLSPREVQVCGMIRGGLGTKDIARLLSLSPRSVEVHRCNIRRKLGIGGLKVNLATYLAGLST
jgi:PAS domain S-box-containing protein